LGVPQKISVRLCVLVALWLTGAKIGEVSGTNDLIDLKAHGKA